MKDRILLMAFDIVAITALGTLAVLLALNVMVYSDLIQLIGRVK